MERVNDSYTLNSLTLPLTGISGSNLLIHDPKAKTTLGARKSPFEVLRRTDELSSVNPFTFVLADTVPPAWRNSSWKADSTFYFIKENWIYINILLYI